jgi:hypothetical protein
MELKSPAFEKGGRIPAKYTCDGDDVSPPLEIVDIPEETETLALVMDDPDAPMGVFDHWVVWNIPADTTEIAEDTQPDGTPGRNDFGRLDYGGPCPPSGTHTYRLRVYALDRDLDLPRGSAKGELQREMEGHVLDESLLTGDYSRG